MTEQPEIWRTDPRERLLAAIDSTWALDVFGTTPERLVDGYAHQLAELQRLRMDELDLTGQKARVVGRIVDLIDPETQR